MELRIKKQRIILNLITTAITLYAILDLQNSAIVGKTTANRTVVYVMLGSIIGLALVGILIKKKISFAPFSSVYFYNALWIIIVDVFLCGNLEWQSIIHIFLAILWLLIYQFYFQSLADDIDVFRYAQKYFSLLVYLYVLATIMAVFRVRMISTRRTAVQLSTSYYVLVFLPIVLSNPKGLFRNVSIAAIVISVFVSFKRGSIIAIAFMLLVYLFVHGKIQKKNGTFLRIILIGAGLVFVLLLFDSISGGILMERFTLESLAEGSGRRVIYTNGWNAFLRAPLFLKMFGSGSGATIRMLGHAAHNEWLEFLIGYGIIGVLLYLRMILSFVSCVARMIRQNDRRAPFLACAAAYFVCVSMYGAIYFAQSTLYIIAIISLFSTNGVEEYLE